MNFIFFFFFQAEDGIRDFHVTGVQTCALPISIGALTGDRLVLRDATATRTIGGGVLIDPFPPRRGRRTPERLAQLQALDQADPIAALQALLAQPPGWT